MYWSNGDLLYCSSVNVRCITATAYIIHLDIYLVCPRFYQARVMKCLSRGQSHEKCNATSQVLYPRPHPGGSVVSVSDSWPGGCKFDSRLRPLFFPAYFRLLPLQKHVRKVVGGFGKKSCVSTGVRKPGNTCVTDRLDMTLVVKVALNPNTTNQIYTPASELPAIGPCKPGDLQEDCCKGKVYLTSYQITNFKAVPNWKHLQTTK